MPYIPSIDAFIAHLQHEIKTIVQQNFIGSYIHGSLAMGGFNAASSDIDLLIVTQAPLPIEEKKQLAALFLTISKQPYPIEISFLQQQHLQNWQHPCPYDFHYSEDWRARFTEDLHDDKKLFINEGSKTDADLAAHITILHERGICYKGKAIDDVFPIIPKEDYLDSIMQDFNDCLASIEEKPIYCILNLLRVYLFVKEGLISSKLEAGIWGSASLPSQLKVTAAKALDVYQTNATNTVFSSLELQLFQQYISKNLKGLL